MRLLNTPRGTRLPYLIKMLLLSVSNTHLDTNINNKYKKYCIKHLLSYVNQYVRV